MKKGKRKKFKAGVIKAAPVFFSAVAAAGVVATFFLTIRDTHKADKRIEELHEKKEDPSKIDIFVAAAPAYVPSVTVGIVTISSIALSDILNRKQKAAIMGAYILTRNSYERYRHKVKDTYGVEAHNKILNEIAVEQAEQQTIYAGNFINQSSNRNVFDDEDTRLFYDSFSNRYFESTLPAVLDAQYHLNRNYVLGGYVFLNDYYKFLGLESTPEGDLLGWDTDEEYDGIWWLDFDMHKTNLGSNINDQLNCIIIDMAFEPVLLSKQDRWK